MLDEIKLANKGISYEAIKDYSRKPVAKCNDCMSITRQFCFAEPQTFCEKLVEQFKFSQSLCVEESRKEK